MIYGEGIASYCLTWSGFIFVHIILMVYTAVWIFFDSRARGGGSLYLYLIAVALIGFPVAFVWISLRPKGEMMKCSRCGKRMLGSLDHCPHCDYGKQRKSERKVVKVRPSRRSSSGHSVSDEEEMRERWRRRELWVRTAPTDGNEWEEPEERIKVQDTSRIKGAALRKARRTSGICPNCGRELYDWEDRCVRCGKKF